MFCKRYFKIPEKAFMGRESGNRRAVCNAGADLFKTKINKTE